MSVFVCIFIYGYFSSNIYILYTHSVSGGPFGMEEALRTAGPLVTMIGLAVLPLLWSCPEALITAELAPSFREASGSVAWVSCAFGNFWGFMKVRIKYTPTE